MNHFVRTPKGLIALDIDGTITAFQETIPNEVQRYFKELYDEGWSFLFVTGRIFFRAIGTLSCLEFPHFVSPQNGTVIVEMPEKRVVERNYFQMTQIHEIVREVDLGFVAYGGFDQDDQCFFSPKHFTQDLLEYFSWRQSQANERWNEVESFEEVPYDALASLKWFGPESAMDNLAQVLESQWGLHAPVIRDPFDHKIFILQATQAHVNKGAAAKSLRGYLGLGHLPLIAAGDDKNDLPLLEAADFAIAMETGPEILRVAGDVIAPSAEQFGIIQGLKEALRNC